MNGAQWLVQALRTQGVDTVFGYPGGAIMPVYDALYDGGVEHVLCRHEQGRLWRQSAMHGQGRERVYVSQHQGREQQTLSPGWRMHCLIQYLLLPSPDK